MSTEATAVELQSDLEVVITREFRAPRSLVFDTLTNPAYLKRWYGLRILTLSVCEIDLRVGGRWRYVLRAPDGSEHAFSGEYREIVKPSRIVATETYEALPAGHEMLVTLTLEEAGGVTTLTNRILYKSKEDRDAHIQSGMEHGMRESYQRLDELLPQAS